MHAVKLMVARAFIYVADNRAKLDNLRAAGQE